MSNILIGVGGSGQHMVHAYLRILEMSNADRANLPHVYIIDADAQQSQTNTQDTENNDTNPSDRPPLLINEIENTFKYINSRGANHDLAGANFDIISPYAAIFSNNNTLTAKNVFEYHTTLEQPIKNEQIRAFFNNEDLDVNVKQGMHANPKVGSAIFGNKLARLLDTDGKIDQENKEVLIEEFKTLFTDEVTGSNAGGANIVIVGSVFGGTGSGIIPTLARQLGQVLNGQVSITTVATLPWFSLTRNDDGLLRGTATDIKKIDRNTTFALRNFHNQAQRSTNLCSVFIQPRDSWAIIPRKSAGDFKQPEHQHVINLLATNAIQHAFNNTFEAGNLYFPLSNDSKEINYGQFHPHMSRHLHFTDLSQLSNSQVKVSLWTLMVKSLIAAMTLEVLITLLNSYNGYKFYLDDIGDNPLIYDGTYRLLKEVTEKFNESFFEQRVWMNRFFGKPKLFVSQHVVNEFKTSVQNEFDRYTQTLDWLYKHDYPEHQAQLENSQENQQASGILHDFLLYQSFFNSNGENKTQQLHKLIKHATANTQIVNSKGEQSGQAVNVIKDEIWLSVASKIIKNALFNDNSNQKGKETEQPLKDGLIQIITNAANRQSYSQVASCVADFIYKELDRYILSSSEFDNHFNQETETSSITTNEKLLTALEVEFKPQDGENVDSFAKFDWSALEGNDGDDNKQAIMRPDHPKSLYWVDTLSTTRGAGMGVGQHFVDKIKVDESCTQGLPNILAGMQMQQWRLQGDAYRFEQIATTLQNANLNQQYYVNFDDDGHLHSTRHGLYLYAQRVNETAFWLLLSGAVDVRYIVSTLINHQHDANNAYCRWLSSELKEKGFEQYKLGMIVKTVQGQDVPLFVWNGYFWTLASNETAQQYLADRLNQKNNTYVPTVKCCYSFHFSRLNEPKTIGNQSKLNYFIEQLDKLKEVLVTSNQQNINSEHTALLRSMVTGILTDLPEGGIANDVKAESLDPSVQLGSSTISSNNDTDSTKKLDMIGPCKSIKNISKYLIKDPKVIFIEKSPSKSGSLLNVRQFLPVKKEYWTQGLVASTSSINSSDGNNAHVNNHNNIDTGLTSERRDQIHSNLHFDSGDNNKCRLLYTDLYVPDLQNIERYPNTDQHKELLCIHSQLHFGIGIWPDFKAKGWHYYMLSVDIIKGLKYRSIVEELEAKTGSNQLVLTIYDTNLKEETKVEFGYDAVPIKIDFVPAVVELSCGSTIIGTQPITLRDISANNQEAKCIGIDFGTSNTCMSVTLNGEGSKNINLANTTEEPLHEKIIFSIDNPNAKNDWLKNRAGFYLQRQAVVSDTACYAIPSELLLGLSTRTINSNNLPSYYQNRLEEDATNQSIGQDNIQLDKLLKDSNNQNGILANAPTYTPLCNDFYGWENIQDKADLFNLVLRNNRTHQRIFDDIKWPNSYQSTTSNTSEALRNTYLEQILVVALARLRELGIDNIGYLFATRPDAFVFEQGDFAKSYIQKLEETIKVLSEKTGMSFSLDKVVEISETASAMTLADIQSGKKVSHIVMDIGGGTTDIHIKVKYQQEEITYSSSIRWAGNDLLDIMLTKNSNVREYLIGQLESHGRQIDTSDSANTEVILKSYLKQLIRDGFSLMSQQTLLNSAKVSQIKDVFFASLYEYIFVKLKMLMQQAGVESLDNLVEGADDLGTKLNIVIQGNGFRLADYFNRSNRYNYENAIKDVFTTVFADDSLNTVPDFMDKINISIANNSKQEMIAKGGNAVANRLYDSRNHTLRSTPEQVGEPPLLYPPKILDVNPDNQVMLTTFTSNTTHGNTTNDPKIVDEFMDEHLLQQELYRLFPYTYREDYWQNNNLGIPEKMLEISKTFIAHGEHGNQSFHDINAMYLKCSSNDATNYSFLKALKQSWT